MRIFVTGATGFVGSAVVKELVANGHKVLGLTRSDAGAKTLAAEGAEVHRGSLEDLDSLRKGADASDGVIHTAFIHDFSNYAESCTRDKEAIDAMGTTLAGSNRPLIVTSGVGLLSPGKRSTEETPHPPSTVFPRVSEHAAEAFTSRGVRVSIVRLPPSVHGEGDHGFIPILIRIAREKGAAAHIDEGKNLWPAVHRLDAARLYRLIAEKGTAGAIYHGVAEEGVPFREIAGVIGRRLNIPVVSKKQEEAAEHFGWFARFAAIDAPSSGQLTQKRLGWQPTHAGLIADIDQPSYFTN